MGGHGRAIVLDLAWVDHRQIMKAEVLHGPGHGAHIAIVERLHQDDPQLHPLDTPMGTSLATLVAILRLCTTSTTSPEGL